MANFTFKEYAEFLTRTPVVSLVRNGKELIGKFIEEIKNDKNLAPELADLFAHLETVANRKQPPPNVCKHLTKYLGKKVKYTVYELKSNAKNLRMYVMMDEACVMILGGKKGDQDEDIERVKKLVQEYGNSKK